MNKLKFKIRHVITDEGVFLRRQDLIAFLCAAKDVCKGAEGKAVTQQIISELSNIPRRS